MKQCPYCHSQKVYVMKHDIVDHVVTGYDPNNGPVYFAECGCCCAHGPVVSWAADAVEVFINPSSFIKCLEDQRKEDDRDQPENIYDTMGITLGNKTREYHAPDSN